MFLVRLVWYPMQLLNTDKQLTFMAGACLINVWSMVGMLVETSSTLQCLMNLCVTIIIILVIPHGTYASQHLLVSVDC